jgi:catechol 2,3-dioxygenase-like lactoylglutathione lyase family enzyme
MEVRPRIVAPVSRAIATWDIARSAAFYRDVLGFDIHEAPDGTEASSGPALLHFDADGRAPAIVFFETDDVDAMHAAIRARGGETSEIAKVNWIKMRMFEIRDPDGNILWFGQSFDKPDAVAPAAMFHKALPGCR